MFNKLSLLFTAGLLSLSLAAPVESSTSLEARGYEWDRSGLNPLCFYDGDSIVWHYFVVIPEDDKLDKSCGNGFLDNLHGQSLVITQWGCTWGFGGQPSNSGTADFKTTVATTSQIQNAYKAAVGKDLTCEKIGSNNLAQVRSST